MRGIDEVGGADLGRHLQLRGIGVDGEYAPRTRDRGAVHGRHADTTATDDGDSLAGGHLGRVHGCAEARNDATADQRRTIHGEILVDLHHGVLMHEHHLGMRRQVREGVDVAALHRQALDLARQRLDLGIEAEHGAARVAVLAGAAEHRQAGDDVIAFLDVAHFRADFLDDAGGLVAEHDGHGDGDRALR